MKTIEIISAERNRWMCENAFTVYKLKNKPWLFIAENRITSLNIAERQQLRKESLTQ